MVVVDITDQGQIEELIRVMESVKMHHAFSVSVRIDELDGGVTFKIDNFSWTRPLGKIRSEH